MKKILGLNGDALLDALDTMEDIKAVGGIVDNEGVATLYHRTSREKAEKIVSQQYMITKEDCIYMSTHHDKQTIGYGDTVIEIKIPVNKLILDDDFGDELHYKIMCGFKSGMKINTKIKGE